MQAIIVSASILIMRIVCLMGGWQRGQMWASVGFVSYKTKACDRMPPAIPTLSSQPRVASPPPPDLVGARCQLLTFPLLYPTYLMFHNSNKMPKGSLINMILKSVPLAMYKITLHIISTSISFLCKSGMFWPSFVKNKTNKYIIPVITNWRIRIHPAHKQYSCSLEDAQLIRIWQAERAPPPLFFFN